MQLYEIHGKKPKISPNVAFIGEDVKIIGDVEIAEDCVIFDNVVIEGYPIKIKIGKGTNIQSGTIIHGLNDIDTIIGNYNTIGHNSVIHGCTLEDYVVVGIGSVVMGKTRVGMGSLIGAGSLVTENKVFPPKSVIIGHPAKVIRDLTAEEFETNKVVADRYIEEGRQLTTERKRIN